MSLANKGLVEVKKLFLDRVKVENRIHKTSLNIKKAQGALARGLARASMRKGGKGRKSTPGSPPLAIKGLIRKFLFYAYDPATDSVFVGPIKLQRGTEYDGVGIPELLENGGTVITKSGRRATYQNRPYMNPAFERTIKKTPSIVNEVATKMGNK